VTTNHATRLPLEGLGVLITRPRRQAERLARTIEAAGGEAVVFPTIEIQPMDDDVALRALLANLANYHVAIFVSANAVEEGMRYLSSMDKRPSTLRFAAIGDATRKALQNFGVDSVIAPVDRFDSEALLDLQEMRDVAGKRMIIFRGEGGRNVLAETLTNRGAMVDHAVCYKRIRPQQDISLLRSRWQTGDIQAVSAMSLESLTNLYDILDEPTRRLLAETPVFVPHPRIAAGGKKMGIADVRVTGASDDDLIKELSKYHAG